MYRVIQFVKSEKYGIKIPLNNVNDRLCAMLGVSSRSIDNLKKELKEIEIAKERSSRRLRSGSNTITTDDTVEQPMSVSGRPKIHLSDFGKDMIRYEFHLLLAERVYPTLDRMMTRLLVDFPDFPIKNLGIKNQIRQWLIDHSVPFIDQYSKSELLELSYAYAPEKEYIVDETAKQFDIEIIRLPVRHCILNPIEICWAELKKSVRDQNTTFKLKDVEKLIWNWLNNCDSTFISNCIDHVQVYEENFKKADQFIEQIENELNDDDNIDNDSDLTEDEDEDEEQDEDKGEGEDEDQ
ncbi:unnamed protein product [Rotaria sp. Silwood2]|nr:unnamed protein product [Rotaria sp. Silwood2]CAF2849096.1 unnamed protein product [Rotaria sp. Silwood2]CAF4548788.1 unnamed protein product [Rotaria sp. Silwood2]